MERFMPGFLKKLINSGLISAAAVCASAAPAQAGTQYRPFSISRILKKEKNKTGWLTLRKNGAFRFAYYTRRGTGFASDTKIWWRVASARNQLHPSANDWREAWRVVRSLFLRTRRGWWCWWPARLCLATCRVKPCYEKHFFKKDRYCKKKRFSQR